MATTAPGATVPGGTAPAPNAGSTATAIVKSVSVRKGLTMSLADEIQDSELQEAEAQLANFAKYNVDSQHVIDILKCFGKLRLPRGQSKEIPGCALTTVPTTFDVLDAMDVRGMNPLQKATYAAYCLDSQIGVGDVVAVPTVIADFEAILDGYPTFAEAADADTAIQGMENKKWKSGLILVCQLSFATAAVNNMRNKVLASRKLQESLPNLRTGGNQTGCCLPVAMAASVLGVKMSDAGQEVRKLAYSIAVRGVWFLAAAILSRKNFETINKLFGEFARSFMETSGKKGRTKLSSSLEALVPRGLMPAAMIPAFRKVMTQPLIGMPNEDTTLGLPPAICDKIEEVLAYRANPGKFATDRGAAAGTALLDEIPALRTRRGA